MVSYLRVLFRAVFATCRLGRNFRIRTQLPSTLYVPGTARDRPRAASSPGLTSSRSRTDICKRDRRQQPTKDTTACSDWVTDFCDSMQGCRRRYFDPIVWPVKTSGIDHRGRQYPTFCASIHEIVHPHCATGPRVQHFDLT